MQFFHHNELMITVEVGLCGVENSHQDLIRVVTRWWGLQLPDDVHKSITKPLHRVEKTPLSKSSGLLCNNARPTFPVNEL